MSMFEKLKTNAKGLPIYTNFSDEDLIELAREANEDMANEENDSEEREGAFALLLSIDMELGKRQVRKNMRLVQ